MKKVLFAILAAMTVLFVSCDPDEAANTATVSFVSPVAAWADGVATIEISVSGYSGDAVSIPVVFGGDAVKGTDYTLSAEAFVVGGTSPVTTITVTPTESGAEKSVTATLSAPSGFVLGQIPMCQVEMEGFVGWASFVSATDVLKASLDITVGLYDNEGSSLRPETAQTVEIEVDTENSTAVEGEHFEFADGVKGVFIDAGKRNGILTINCIKVEDGHDKIVLKIKESSRFYEGQTGTMTITIAGPDWNKISGKWVMNEIVTDVAYFQEVWNPEWFTVTYDGFPEFNENDSVTIDTESGKFSPSFSSTFNTYFLGESNMTNDGDFYMRTGMEGGVQLQIIGLDNINRYFSPTETSEDKTALVGVQIITDSNGQELLDMYIIDYIPHAFMKELDDGNTYDRENKPAAASTGCYLNMTFKRAE